MEVTVLHHRNKESVAFARGHQVICDQPVSEGGADAGMTPPELLLSAIGACAMHYAAEFLKARNLSVEKIRIKVTGDKSGPPVRIENFGIEIDVPGLSTRLRDGLIRAVDACLIHRTLKSSNEIRIRMASEVVESENYKPVPA
jgi:uncharacterized OsmC-like protein